MGHEIIIAWAGVGIGVGQLLLLVRRRRIKSPPMVPRIIAAVFAGLLFSQPAWAVVSENPTPGSIKSGVGLVSGWICEADLLEVSFNRDEPLFMPYGSERVDTESVCGDTDNGFGLLINYNNLGNGPHTVTLYADGEVATQVHFNVQTLGTDFLRGVTGQGTVELSDGKHVAVQWQETIQGFAITDYNYTGYFEGQDDESEICTPATGPGPESAQFTLPITPQVSTLRGMHGHSWQ